MSEQQENVNAELESDQTEAEYEGDIGDAVNKKGGAAGIIGLGSCI
jgi:hypothetical protein